jgi:hypothetical protein
MGVGRQAYWKHYGLVCKVEYGYRVNPSNSSDKSDHDKMAKLLEAMAKHLGYKNLDWTTIKTSYLPKEISDYWFDNDEYKKLQIENLKQQNELLKLAPKLLSTGTISIPQEKILDNK